jgi:hypothetical protein
MLWQDGLALLIVAIAALAVLRIYAPAGMFRLGARQEGDGSIQNAPPAGGCSGCTLGASCAKAQLKVYPVVIQQHEQFPPR